MVITTVEMKIQTTSRFQHAPPEPSRGCNGKKPMKRLFGTSDITVRLFIMEGSDMPLFLDSMKLSIKSLKVLDLRIEIPATATVGSLKTGIFHGDKRHRLSALEPKHVHITPPPHSNDCPLLSDGTSQGLTGLKRVL
ncbi:hypothetical protein WN944_003989 [Citrus x changshan-huyou]|uniref:Telomere repeat-binding protein 1-6-like ubiquitin-like domain-containing protein n=1 Tax=Citrus x changshan-huyou TaxID=2935761 RepID=A0AAP0LZK1_9ROSI